MLKILRPFEGDLRAAGIDPEEVDMAELTVSEDMKTPQLKVRLKPRYENIDIIISKVSTDG
jgi:hypothetical protein